MTTQETHPIADLTDEALQGMLLIVFSDVETILEKKTAGRSKGSSAGDSRVLELEQELQHSREEPFVGPGQQVHDGVAVRLHVHRL